MRCWDRFARIVVIGCLKYKERIDALKAELKRVGLEKKYRIQYDVENPFIDYLQKHLTFEKGHEKWFRCGYNHYRAIKEAYELGYPSILLIEDDIRFLEDLGKIEKFINKLPEDYDLAMLDKAWIQYQTRQPQDSSEGWHAFTELHSSGCYALSRNGMERWIEAYEEAAFNKKLLKSNDQYFSKNAMGRAAKLVYHTPNIAIQMISGNVHMSIMDRYYANHILMGLKLEDYHLDFPIVTRENFLELLYRRVDEQSRERGRRSKIEDIIILNPREDIHFPEYSSVFGSEDGPEIKSEMPDYRICIWGNNSGSDNQNALQLSYKKSVPVLLCEDGFIRSYDTWCGKSSQRFRKSHSVCFDTEAYYFDAIRVSTIEKMLNDPTLIVSDNEKAEARGLIRKIVENKVSKYNHQPLECPDIGRKGVRKVLVVDQSYGDFSIKRGLADDTTFEKMLKAAKEENPEADILVKTHPDTIAGKNSEKKGYYQDLTEHDNIYKVTFPINPYSLMEKCDKVYVCSSQFGLEALMAGKEVHVFGMPFYAGWGLTTDAQRLNRRTNKRTLEELFYIFYCLYTHWIDPDKGCETTIDDVIDKIIALRDDNNRGKVGSGQRECNARRPSGYRLLGTTHKIYYGPQQGMCSAKGKGTWW